MAPRPGEQPDADILTLWERGAAAAPIERALLLAGEARPDLGMQQCWALPLGQRDQAIAALRTRLFGPAAELTSRCPRCGTEMEVVVADVARVFGEASASTPPCPPLQGLSLRAVTSEDLAAAEAAAAQGRDLRATIIERIATIAEGETVPELDPSTLDTALESLDAAAELRFELACSNCGNRWIALFDIADCTWRELARAAGRIADEVAALASAYGWCEADTLAMGRARRALYLERIPGMSGFLSRLLHRAGIAIAPDEEISLLRDRSPARFEPLGPEPAVLEESAESNSPAPAASVAASGAREFIATSAAIPGRPRFAQPGIQASLDLKAPAVPRDAPVQVAGSSVDFDATPGRSAGATAPPAHPILTPDRRPAVERHSSEVLPVSASVAAPTISPPNAPGNADQRPLTPHPQSVRQREARPKDLLPSSVQRPSVSAPGIRRVETPAPDARSPQQTEPPPETIIEIARVEIVASQPEPRRMVAPVSRKPTTSLADYLARRRR